MKPYFTYGAKASDRDLVTSTVKYSNTLKRYFSSLDAEIFIGGERILDINRIDFSYEEKKLPIYGFNSFIPSRIIVGQKIIQGTFIINFTEVGYIANLLEKIDESAIANQWDKVGVSCDINNAALFKKSFDILIGYGGYDVPEETSYKSTYQILQGVYINGYQQILDTSGEPIYEVYSFIARNLAFSKKKIDEPLPPVEQIVGDKGEKDTFVKVEEDKVDIIDENENNEPINEDTISVNLKYIPLTDTTSKIRLVFSSNMLKRTITDVRLNIADIEIQMSKSFVLKREGVEWVYHLSKIDTDKLNKKFKKNNSMNCTLEVKIKNPDDTITNKTKSVKMYK